MCRDRFVALLVLSLLASATLAAGPALAAAQHGDEPAKAEKHGKGATGEHPAGTAHPTGESPIFPWAPDLAIWTFVVFLLLLFILTKFAWKPMLEGLRKREETIRTAVEEAKLARSETERVRNEFQAEMARAYEQIPKMLEEARRDAARLAEEMRTKAAADIQTDRQRLRREIETARDQALKELWTQAAQLATLISAKALRRGVSEEDHRRLVDDALAELRQAGDKRHRETQM